MVRAFEPLNEVPAEAHIKVNTEQSLEKSLLELLDEGYERKCTQVKQALLRVNSNES